MARSRKIGVREEVLPGKPFVVWESGSEVGDFRIVAVPDDSFTQTDGMHFFLEMRVQPDAMRTERWKGLNLPIGEKRAYTDIVLEKMILWVARVALENEYLRDSVPELVNLVREAQQELTGLDQAALVQDIARRLAAVLTGMSERRIYAGTG